VSATPIDRRLAGLLVSLLLATVAVTPAQLATNGDAAQTHAVQTHA
jgi:hypothetical protein